MCSNILYQGTCVRTDIKSQCNSHDWQKCDKQLKSNQSVDHGCMVRNSVLCLKIPLGIYMVGVKSKGSDQSVQASLSL